MTTRFRPHHFLCALGFRGKGYSPEFVKGFQAVVDRLRAPEGDAELIEVVESTDTICEPCPHRRGNLCETEGKIRSIDAAHARVLGLRGGDRLTWGEAKDRIVAGFTVEAHRRALPSMDVFTYPAGHAFNRDVDPKAYDKPSARLALARSLAFMAEHLR